MNAKIGNRIRALREGKGLSQKEIAEKLNISQSAYSRIETGETNGWVHLIEKLCRELEIKPEELFNGIESINQNDVENYSSAVLNNVYSDAHITINHLSDKAIELYEGKIRQLEEEIKQLKGSK